MATANFSSIYKKIFNHSHIILFIALSLQLSACQNIKTRNDIQKEEESKANIPPALSPELSQPKQVTDLQLPSQEALANQNSQPSSELPKIGVILGPGGLRSYAHIGVLQELNRARIPIMVLSGLEMGALISGIYANKGQPHDVEWQMMKLKSEDIFKKNLVLGRSAQDMLAMRDFLQNALGKTKAEDAKISFFCPSFNLERRQIFILSQGPLTTLMDHCVPYYPFLRPYNKNIAGLTALTTVVQQMKSRGASYIIYVDLLNDKSVPFFSRIESDENVTWSAVAQGLDAQVYTVNKVIKVPLRGYYLDDFNKRREMIKVGHDIGRQLVMELQKELGF